MLSLHFLINLMFFLQECYGYTDSRWRKVLLYMGVLLSAGLLLLVMYWRPAWKLKLTKRRCALRCADTVLLKVSYIYLLKIHVSSMCIKLSLAKLKIPSAQLMMPVFTMSTNLFVWPPTHNLILIVWLKVVMFANPYPYRKVVVLEFSHD